MRILICDDDESIVKQLEKYIAEFFNHGKIKVPEIQSYNNGEALLSDTSNKDIVFLDIELPGVDGIFVGRELKEKNHNAIIFVIYESPWTNNAYFRNLVILSVTSKILYFLVLQCTSFYIRKVKTRELTSDKSTLFLTVIPLVSSKQNKRNHGYGMKSIQRVVTKYHGNSQFHFEPENSTFHTVIILKL